MNENRMDIEAGPIIQFDKVNKWFENFHVLNDIDLKVGRGERIVICGPSGSGKSTLIRCINRLEEHQEGNIIVDGIELTDDVKNIDAIRSEVGMVFQSFNLFPHLSVIDNLIIGQHLVRKLPKSDAADIAMAYLKRVKIDDQAEKFPGQIEIIDLRTLYPLDEELIFQSVKTHSRCLIITEEPRENSFALALSGKIQEQCFSYLDAPVKVIGSENVPAIPLNAILEQHYLPNAEKVTEDIKTLIEF